MKKRAKKALPLYTKPAKSMTEYAGRVLGLLRSGWCQNALAKSHSGKQVDVLGKYVGSVCLLGALERSDDSEKHHELEGALNDLLPDMTFIEEFNDAHERKKSEVIALVKRAARKLGVKVK